MLDWNFASFVTNCSVSLSSPLRPLAPLKPSRVMDIIICIANAVHHLIQRLAWTIINTVADAVHHLSKRLGVAIINRIADAVHHLSQRLAAISIALSKSSGGSTPSSQSVLIDLTRSPEPQRAFIDLTRSPERQRTPTHLVGNGGNSGNIDDARISNTDSMPHAAQAYLLWWNQFLLFISLIVFTSSIVTLLVVHLLSVLAQCMVDELGTVAFLLVMNTIFFISR